ncbi:MAG: glycosyltransferase [Pirellula sp.]
MSNSITPSVIIPVLNNPKGLERCVKAIRRGGLAFELIIVDNGSSDETLEIANRYADKVLVCPGLTIGAMRNQGAKAASSSILVFTDSDQEPAEDWLAVGLLAIQSDQEVGLAGARYHALPESRWVARSWDLQRSSSNHAGDIGWLQGGNLFARREAFERVGGFRSDLIASEDVDLSIRMRLAGYRVVCDPRIVNFHHGDPQTLWEFFNKERWRGSSGWRAWATQGCPLDGLTSLLWPVWVVAGLPVLGGICLSLNAYWMNLPSWVILLASFLVWLFPAVSRAVRICPNEVRSVTEVARLAVLYLVYGLARLASVALPSKGSKQPW